jgi:NAD(P)-dependent dehydrogenase (short-subunit alcohol dehydrogenase family)
VAFFGTGGYLLWRESRKHKKKRRARRASNGARREVVVVAGCPSSPIVKSLALDLERRGFIVYVVCKDMEEEQQVHSESRIDVKPLHVDVTDPMGTREAMERFAKVLNKPPFSGKPSHNMNFSGLILVPDLIYPSGPIETISPELWSDALNAKVLNTIALTQTFLPTICAFNARVLMLTPSIVAALRPPFHSVETAVVNALEGFTASLRGELGTLGIHVCQFKLGTFDYSHVGARQHLQSIGSPSTDQWSTEARLSYESNFVNQSRIARNRGLFAHNGNSGSSMRELQYAVFDALTQKHPRRVWHVGRGSVTYDLVGNWLPGGLVGRMLGVRRVSLDETAEPHLEDSAQSWEKVETAVT